MANSHYEKLLEGVPENIKTELENALISYLNKGKSVAEDERIATNLRRVFDPLYEYLIENRLTNLTLEQKTFLCTGAVGDRINIKKKDGTEITVELLEKEIYEELINKIKEVDTLPAWTDQIYTTYDKFRAICNLELEPFEVATSRTKIKKKATLKEAEEKEELLKKKMQIETATKETLKKFEDIFHKFVGLLHSENIQNLKSYYNSIISYIDILTKTAVLSPRELENKKLLEDKVNKAFPFMNEYAEKITTRSAEFKNIIQEVDTKLSELHSIISQVAKLGSKTRSAISRRKEHFSVDREKIRLIKHDIDTTNQVIIRGADTARERIPFSASRILTSEHTYRMEDPLNNCYCTPQNVAEALKKITKIHINLFPTDVEGNPIIPPFIIEPIRNYIEWFDDRMIISFVSGEPPRKGPKYSFSSVEMLVLKGCGLYLAKDPIYDYRGERNVGTFMGDYAGHIEKKAVVRWTGEKKQRTLTMETEIMDEASREEAVRDYQEFIYCIANGFPPPARISQRKIAVFLNYVIIESIETTIKLIIKYMLNYDRRLARDRILVLGDRKRDKAKKLVENAFSDPTISREYRGEFDVYMDKVLGKDF